MSESQKRNKLADLLFLGGTLSAVALLANYSPGSTDAVPLRDGQAIHLVGESADELQKSTRAVEEELERLARESEVQCKLPKAQPIIMGRMAPPRVVEPQPVRKAHPNPNGGMIAPGH